MMLPVGAKWQVRVVSSVSYVVSAVVCGVVIGDSVVAKGLDIDRVAARQLVERAKIVWGKVAVCDAPIN